MFQSQVVNLFESLGRREPASRDSHNPHSSRNSNSDSIWAGTIPEPVMPRELENRLAA